MEFLKSEILLHPVLEVGSRAEQSFSAAAKMLEMHGEQSLCISEGVRAKQPLWKPDRKKTACLKRNWRMLDELIGRVVSLGRLLNACSRSGCRLRWSIRKLLRVYRTFLCI